MFAAGRASHSTLKTHCLSDLLLLLGGLEVGCRSGKAVGSQSVVSHDGNCQHLGLFPQGIDSTPSPPRGSFTQPSLPSTASYTIRLMSLSTLTLWLTLVLAHPNLPHCQLPAVTGQPTLVTKLLHCRRVHRLLRPCCGYSRAPEQLSAWPQAEH